MPEIILTEEGHKYFVDGKPYPGVNEALRDMGYQNVDFIPKEALERGKDVHTACEFYDTGRLDFNSVHPDHKGYLIAWIRFRKETGYEPYHTELKVFCPFPAPYCGQIDSIGWLKGQRVMVDRKSGLISRSFPLKMAAYNKALPKDEPKIEKFLAVKLNKDGTYQVIEVEVGAREYALVDAIFSAWWGRKEYGQ